MPGTVQEKLITLDNLERYNNHLYEEMSQDDYQEITPEANKTYFIPDYDNEQSADASAITYSNTTSGLQASNVQDAIDELSSEKKDEYITITYQQQQAMTPEQQAEKDYYITDYSSNAIDASNIGYSNTVSGLSATNAQGAIDELASEKKDEYDTITYAQWQEMTPTQKAEKDYYISDYPSSAITAGNISYSNTTSGLDAQTIQAAIDELKSMIDELNT